MQVLYACDFPRKFVEECSKEPAAGDASPDLTQWRESLGISVSLEKAIPCLVSNGYTDQQLDELADDDEATECILKLAACAFVKGEKVFVIEP